MISGFTLWILMIAQLYIACGLVILVISHEFQGHRDIVRSTNPRNLVYVSRRFRVRVICVSRYAEYLIDFELLVARILFHSNPSRVSEIQR